MFRLSLYILVCQEFWPGIVHASSDAPTNGILGMTPRILRCQRTATVILQECCCARLVSLSLQSLASVKTAARWTAGGPEPKVFRPLIDELDDDSPGVQYCVGVQSVAVKEELHHRSCKLIGLCELIKAPAAEPLLRLSACGSRSWSGWTNKPIN